MISLALRSRAEAVAGELLFRPFFLRIPTQCNIVTLRSKFVTRSIRQGQGFRALIFNANFCLEELKMSSQGSIQEFFGLGVLAPCCWFLADLLFLDLTSRPNV